MKTTFTIVLWAIWMLVPPAAGAAGEIVDATDPEKLLGVAKKFGDATLSTDGIGDPLITGHIDGVSYSMFFWGCKRHRNCTDIQFVAGWKDADLTLDQINFWNRRQRFGNAHIDGEGDVILTYAVNLHRGVTYANMEASFVWWKLVQTSFIGDVLGAVR